MLKEISHINFFMSIEVQANGIDIQFKKDETFGKNYFTLTDNTLWDKTYKFNW